MKITLNNLKRAEVLLALYNAAKEADPQLKNSPNATIEDAEKRLTKPVDEDCVLYKYPNVIIDKFKGVSLKLKFSYYEKDDRTTAHAARILEGGGISTLNTDDFDDMYGEYVAPKAIAQLRQQKITTLTSEKSTTSNEILKTLTLNGKDDVTFLKELEEHAKIEEEFEKVQQKLFAHKSLLIGLRGSIADNEKPLPLSLMLPPQKTKDADGKEVNLPPSENRPELSYELQSLMPPKDSAPKLTL